jgi:hypothetical protein
MAIGIVTFACHTQASVGQTAQQLASQYQALNAYEIRPGVLMISKFDTGGQICEALVQPLRVGSASKAQQLPFSGKLADQLAEEIAPLETRGTADRFFDPDSTVAGGLYELKTNYKFVSIEKFGAFSEDDRRGTIQVLRIIWTKRTCAR